MMVWKCPPLHLPNWNNLWKWKEQMNANELADAIKELEDDSSDYGMGYLKQVANMLRQFDLAQSIIKQQELQIEALKDEVAMWKMSYENNIRMEDGYGLN